MDRGGIEDEGDVVPRLTARLPRVVFCIFHPPVASQELQELLLSAGDRPLDRLR